MGRRARVHQLPHPRPGVRRARKYAADFVTPYRLWLSVLLILVVVWLLLRSQGDRRTRTAIVAMLTAALGAAYIVAIGGDYMHGRLLLPAFFALGLRASVAVRDRALPGAALCSLAATWALVTVIWFRPPPPPPALGFLPPHVADWRSVSGARIRARRLRLGLNGAEARALTRTGCGPTSTRTRPSRPAATTPTGSC